MIYVCHNCGRPVERHAFREHEAHCHGVNRGDDPYLVESVRLTPGDFAALEFVNAQSWIDDYADPENEAQTIEDDELTPKQWDEEHAKAKLFELTPTRFTFVRDSTAFRAAVFGLPDADLSPFDATDAQRAAFRRTCRQLLAKLGTDGTQQ